MKKIVLMFFLLLVILGTGTCPALADEPVTEYQSDFFSFGGDTFVNRGGMMGSGVFYARANSNPLSGSYIVEERRLNIDTAALTDVQLTIWYDLALKEFIGDDEESANMEAIEVEREEARIFNYALSAQGMSFPAACVAIRRNRILIVSYFTRSDTSPEETQKKLIAAGGTIRYLGN